MWQPMHQAPFTRVGHQWQMRSSQPAPPNYAHVVRDLGLTVQGVQGMGTLSHVTAAAGHAAPQPAKEAANGPQLSVPQIDPFSRHQCVGTLRVPQLAHALSHVPAPTKALAQPASTAQSYSPPLSINAAVHSYNPMPKPNPAQSKPVGQDARPPLTINAAVHLHEPVPKPKPAAQTPQSKPDGQDARPPLTISAAVHLHDPVPKPNQAAQTPQSKPDGQDASPPLTISAAVHLHDPIPKPKPAAQTPQSKLDGQDASALEAAAIAPIIPVTQCQPLASAPAFPMAATPPRPNRPESQVATERQPATQAFETAQTAQVMEVPVPESRPRRMGRDAKERRWKLVQTVECEDGVERLDPDEVLYDLHAKQCVLVDVRGNDRASGYIDESIHVPCTTEDPFYPKVQKLVEKLTDESLVVFTCQYSCHRAPTCANWYRAKAPKEQRVAVLEGGFRGWEAAGFPVRKDNFVDEEAADKHAVEEGARVATKQLMESLPSLMARHSGA